MKVLLIHNHYQQYGGEDATVASELSLFADRGFDVRVYSRHNDEINRFGVVDKALFAIQTYHSQRTTSELQKVIDDFKPEIAYVHNVYPLISPSAYNVLAAAKVPIVQVVHNFRPFCANGLFFTNGSICERCLTDGPFEAVKNSCFRDSHALSALYAVSLHGARRNAVPRISAFICQTEFAKRKLAQCGVNSDSIFIRPNCIDTLSIAPAIWPGEYALYMGRLTAEKGLFTLLEAARRNRELPLVVAGTGDLEPEMRRFVEVHRMTHVTFAGFKTGEEKRRLIERSMFVVVPSQCYENLPTSILEAYASGRAVVGSNIGGVGSAVHDGSTGLLVPPGDADYLAAAMQRLARDHASRTSMGKAARRKAEVDYSPGQFFRQTKSIFATVMRAQEVRKAAAAAV